MAKLSGDVRFFCESLPDGIVITDSDGQIQFANRAFSVLIEREPKSVVGQPLITLLADEEVSRLLGFKESFGTNETQDHLMIFTGDHGQRHILSLNSATFGNGSWRLLTARAVGAFHRELAETTRWAASEQTRAEEISRARDTLTKTNAALVQAQQQLQQAYDRLENETAARIKLESELRLSQKLQAVGQLAAGIAHEINTPAQFVGDSMQFVRDAFAGVLNLLQLYRQSIVDGRLFTADSSVLSEISEKERDLDLEFLKQNISDSFDSCFNGISRIATIVQAMKDFAQPDNREKSFADINQAILNTLTISSNEYRYVADVETVLGELPLVLCQLADLNQVFLSLIINAAEAIQSVTQNSQARGKLRIRTRCDSNDVVIEIEDSGCGIPGSIRERVFEPFFTTKTIGQGSGQGLAIARSIIVDKHGGTLTFTSTVGVGTTFVITLPI